MRNPNLGLTSQRFPSAFLTRVSVIRKADGTHLPVRTAACLDTQPIIAAPKQRLDTCLA